MPQLSERVQRVKPSITLAVTARLKEMQAKGLDVISFGAGEPDFDTPINIKAAGIKAIEKGQTKYTACGGLPDLRKAIVQKFKRDNNLDYAVNQVIVSGGAKHSLYNVIQAIVGPGDEVIIPAPYWVSYPDMVLLADGKPVVIQTKPEDNFELSIEALVAALTPKTKAIIINSPSNPTGAVYSHAKLQQIADVLADRDVYIISDEIYEYFLYDKSSFLSIANISDKIKAKTIVVNGVSKAYSMTGWRIGYFAGPAEVVKAVDTIQSQSLSNPTSISQIASIEAILGDQSSVQMMLEAFDERRKTMVQRLQAIAGIKCPMPKGAFYAWADVAAVYGCSYKDIVIKDSITLSNLLLEEALVAVVPGAGFGDDRFIRLSYACSMEQINKGLDRIETFFKLLKYPVKTK